MTIIEEEEEVLSACVFAMLSMLYQTVIYDTWYTNHFNSSVVAHQKLLEF